MWLLSPHEKLDGPSFKQIPFTLEYFVASKVNIGQAVLEENIIKMYMYIFTLLLLSPLRKRQISSFDLTQIPFTQGLSVPSWLKLGPVVLE